VLNVTAEGRSYIEHGSPEIQLLSRLPAEGMPIAAGADLLGAAIFKIAQSQAMSNKWIKIDKGVIVRIVRLSVLRSIVVLILSRWQILP